MKILTVAEVPDDLAQEWLQHLRDFDTGHADCHFEVLAASGRSMEEMVRSIDIDPPLEVKVFKRWDE